MSGATDARARAVIDDDFADFQAAPPSATAAAPPMPSGKPSLMDMLASAPAPATGTPAYAARQPLYTSPATTGAPTGMGMGSGMGSGMGMGMQPTPATYGGGRPLSFAQPALSPTSSSTAPPSLATSPTVGAKKPAGAGVGNFDDLWTMGMSLGSGSKPGTPVGGKRTSMGWGMGAGAAAPAKSMKDLEREKAQAGIWGVGAQKAPQAQQQQQAGAGAFGSFGPAAGGAGGADDLLL